MKYIVAIITGLIMLWPAVALAQGPPPTPPPPDLDWTMPYTFENRLVRGQFEQQFELLGMSELYSNRFLSDLGSWQMTATAVWVEFGPYVIGVAMIFWLGTWIMRWWAGYITRRPPKENWWDGELEGFDGTPDNYYSGGYGRNDAPSGGAPIGLAAGDVASQWSETGRRLADEAQRRKQRF